MTKEEKLKPHLIESIDRLRRFIDLNAPGVIIGMEAFHIFATTLAVYGEKAGSGLISHIRDQNLHGRAVCAHKDCTEYVERPGTGVCSACLKEMGIE